MNTLNVAQFSPFNRRLRKCSGSGSCCVHPFPKTKGMAVHKASSSPSPLFFLFPRSIDEEGATPPLESLITFIIFIRSSVRYLIRNANTEASDFRSRIRWRKVKGGKSRVCLTRLRITRKETRFSRIEVWPRAKRMKEASRGFRITGPSKTWSMFALCETL